MTSLLLKNIGEITTSTGAYRRGRSLADITVLNNQSIYIKDGIINAVGPLEDINRSIGAVDEELDLSGKTVMPGFVDPHTHLVFAGTREDEFAMRIEGTDYMEIAARGGGILNTVRATRSASVEELKSHAKLYLNRALANGTTTIEIKTGYGLDKENEMKMLKVISELGNEHPMRIIPTFLGAHSVPDNKVKESYVVDVIAMMKDAAANGAVYCDVFCEEGFFTVEDSRRILEEARKHGLKVRMHADQFENNSGVDLAVELGAVSVDHLERISEDEIAKLAASDTCAVLTPAVSHCLNYGYPPARKLLDSGCIVALATDFNPGTSMCISMQLVMNIACTQMKMLLPEAVTASTLIGAFSLGMAGEIGSIEVGKHADLIVLDVHTYKMVPYFYGENHVEKVIIDGNIVYSR